jgi:hypothetical protein
VAKMGIEFNLELWKKEVRGLQLTYRIYPDEEVKPPALRELGFLRCAVLLNDGFQKVYKEPMDFKKEFYHLAREYWLNCDPPLPRDKEWEIPQAYSFMPSESSERFSELARATKMGLNLSLRTVEEVGNWGFDHKLMVDFFNFLYRYCPTGYLKVGKYRYNPLVNPPFFRSI